MKAGLLLIFTCLSLFSRLAAQKNCSSSAYQQEQIKKDPALIQLIKQVESFTNRSIESNGVAARGDEAIIKIPVVVHILYHYPSEKISDQKVISQIEALNKCFRRRSADTINTPAYFRPLAADCGIEFQLATSDPGRRATTGIVRKYTPIIAWEADDKMKFSVEMGDDAWDPGSYLNIWVCNLDRVAGYASLPGGIMSKDGIVIGFPAFGTINSMSGYEMGKTAVHEIGHWLGVKHLWGDTYCGDDGVADTPKQAGYNIECPGVINITCGNGPYGDMYMNYMDLTNDACMNLFTKGQKAKMRALFDPGGPRSAILVSKGLNPPLISEIELPEEDPKWLHPQLYPNPATAQITLDLTYDSRWLGKELKIINLQGQTLMNVRVTSKKQQIDISRLQPGVYLLAAKQDDSQSMKLKFVKL